MSHYARAIDELVLEALRELSLPDVEVAGFATETMTSVGPWVGFRSRTHERFTATQHMLGPQLAEIDGDTANARRDLQAVHLLEEPRGDVFPSWGAYRTRMQREASGAWRISRDEPVVRGTDGAPG